MGTAMNFADLKKLFDTDRAEIQVKVPSVKNKGARIFTSLIKWKDDKGTERDVCITGPPCRAYNLINRETKLVTFPKCTLLLEPESALNEENYAKLREFERERADFMTFVRDLEARVHAQVLKDIPSYFMKDVDPKKVSFNSVIRPQKDSEKPVRMGCKIDISQQHTGPKENISPEYVSLKIVDAKDDKKQYTVEEMYDGDIYVPVIGSIYPYMDQRGDCGIQWKLVTLVVLHRGSPPANSESTGNWTDSLKRYMPDEDNTAPMEDKRIKHEMNDEDKCIETEELDSDGADRVTSE